MKSRRVACADAGGLILAHSVQAGAAHLQKGTVLSDADIKTLLAAGVADVTVTDEDFAKEGVGDPQKEMPDRIQPHRLRGESIGRVSAVLLAAGASRRMGTENKLLRRIDGVPLLRRSAQTLLASDIDECIVVIPPDAPEHRKALEGLRVTIIEAKDADLGMSASLRAGVAALHGAISAVLVALADMPDLTPAILNSVIGAHDPSAGRLIIRPLDESGRRGHPVLFDRRFLEDLQQLSGDRGARDILRAVPEAIYEIPLDAAVTLDLDTPQDWADWEKQ